MNYISHQEVAYFGLSQVICLGIGIFYKPMIIYSFILTIVFLIEAFVSCN